MRSRRRPVTPGFNLKAAWVVHAVGPRWTGGSAGEAGLLASCYRRSLETADAVGARSVAFPGISTGLHGYPVDLAAHVAVSEVRTYLARFAHPEQVIFVCFDSFSADCYERELRALSPG